MKIVRKIILLSVPVLLFSFTSVTHAQSQNMASSQKPVAVKQKIPLPDISSLWTQISDLFESTKDSLEDLLSFLGIDVILDSKKEEAKEDTASVKDSKEEKDAELKKEIIESLRNKGYSDTKIAELANQYLSVIQDYNNQHTNEKTRDLDAPGFADWFERNAQNYPQINSDDIINTIAQTSIIETEQGLISKSRAPAASNEYKYETSDANLSPRKDEFVAENLDKENFRYDPQDPFYAENVLAKTSKNDKVAPLTAPQENQKEAALNTRATSSGLTQPLVLSQQPSPASGLDRGPASMHHTATPSRNNIINPTAQQVVSLPNANNSKPFEAAKVDFKPSLPTKVDANTPVLSANDSVANYKKESPKNESKADGLLGDLFEDVNWANNEEIINSFSGDNEGNVTSRIAESLSSPNYIPPAVAAAKEIHNASSDLTESFVENIKKRLEDAIKPQPLPQLVKKATTPQDGSLDNCSQKRESSEEQVTQDIVCIHKHLTKTNASKTKKLLEEQKKIDCLAFWEQAQTQDSNFGKAIESYKKMRVTGSQNKDEFYRSCKASSQDWKSLFKGKAQEARECFSILLIETEVVRHSYRQLRESIAQLPQDEKFKMASFETRKSIIEAQKNRHVSEHIQKIAPTIVSASLFRDEESINVCELIEGNLSGNLAGIESCSETLNIGNSAKFISADSSSAAHHIERLVRMEQSLSTVLSHANQLYGISTSLNEVLQAAGDINNRTPTTTLAYDVIYGQCSPLKNPQVCKTIKELLSKEENPSCDLGIAKISTEYACSAMASTFLDSLIQQNTSDKFKINEKQVAILNHIKNNEGFTNFVSVIMEQRPKEICEDYKYDALTPYQKEAPFIDGPHNKFSSLKTSEI